MVLEFRHTHAVGIILLLEELEGFLLRGIRIGKQCKFYDHRVVIERRRDGIGNRARLGIALLHHQHLHHPRELFLLAGRIVRTREELHQGRILALFHEQVHLAREKRLDVVRLREQNVVHAHEFLLVLDGLEEQAVVVQHLHVLVFRGIQREREVLARRIGDTFLQVNLRHRLVLSDSLLALQLVRLLRDIGRDGVRPHRKHLLGNLERKVTAARVVAPGQHPHGIRLVREPAHLQVHRLDKGGVRSVEVSRVYLAVGILIVRRLCGGRSRSGFSVLLGGCGTARHECSAKCYKRNANGGARSGNCKLEERPHEINPLR